MMNNKHSVPTSGEQQRSAVSDAELRLWHHRIQVGLRAKANIRVIFEQTLANQPKHIVVPLQPTAERSITDTNQGPEPESVPIAATHAHIAPAEAVLTEEEKQLRKSNEA